VRHKEYIQGSNGKLHRNTYLARFRWNSNIKMDVKEIRCGGTSWIKLAEDGENGDLLRKWWKAVGSIRDAGFSNVMSLYETERITDFQTSFGVRIYFHCYRNFNTSPSWSPNETLASNLCSLNPSLSREINNSLPSIVTLRFNDVFCPTASLESQMVRLHLPIWQSI
jgi:hypothetical protein